MSVTGQFKSGRISIPRVTGDIVITVTATNDTTAEIMDAAKYYYPLNDKYIVEAPSNKLANCITVPVPTEPYSSWKTFYMHVPSTTDSIYYIATYDENGYTGTPGVSHGMAQFATVASNADMSTVKSSNVGAPSEKITTRMSLTISSTYIDDAYCYRGDTGQVIFAGKNTPYYGKKYITD